MEDDRFFNAGDTETLVSGKELESLGHAELMTVYETIISLKARHRERDIRGVLLQTEMEFL